MFPNTRRGTVLSHATIVKEKGTHTQYPSAAPSWHYHTIRTTGDQWLWNSDQWWWNSDQNYETVTSDDETVTSDYETVTSDDETVTSDYETVTTDYETVTSDYETGWATALEQ